MNTLKNALNAEEHRTVSLEWKIPNLREVFDSTKGDVKSKVLKSPVFGEGQWQLYFYSNSGDQHISLYLSCEPTAEERARGLPITGGSSQDKSAKALEASSGSAMTDGPGESSWQREGRFKFIFELRSVDKLSRFKCIDATDHQFSSESRNWGWAQFSPRTSVYYNNSKVKADDAILVCCTVAYEPTAPTSHPVSDKIPKSLIPFELVEAYASLFNDRDHSDVQFTIANGTGRPLKLYAIKKILTLRSEYFSVLLSSDWAEGQETPGSPFNVRPNRSTDGNESDSQEDEEEAEDISEDDEDYEGATEPQTPSTESTENALVSQIAEESDLPSYSSTSGGGSVTPTSADDASGHTRSVYGTPARSKHRKGRRGRNDEKINVTVSDSSYKSFRALLYFLYTDSIVFAPLASTYTAARQLARSKGQTFPYASRKEYCKAHVAQTAPHIEGLVKRHSNSAAPGLANAKEIYVLADKLHLPDLKSRAYSHLAESLSVSTVALEVFSPFSQAYTEIQAMQRRYLLKHWKEVRQSLSMREVFFEISKGHSKRYSNFAEIFTEILPSLDYVGVEQPEATVGSNVL